MKTLLQSALLVLVVASLATVVVVASKDEFGDVFDGGKLSRFCRRHLETCDAENVKESLHALHNLEVVQGDLITWRTQWIASTFVALTMLVVAFACGVSVGCVTVLVLAAFFAASFAFHHQHSWYSGHISKHTRDARTQCIQRLQGNPSLEYSYYGM
jgi:hypothetical protein